MRIEEAIETYKREFETDAAGKRHAAGISKKSWPKLSEPGYKEPLYVNKFFGDLEEQFNALLAALQRSSEADHDDWIIVYYPNS